MPFLQIQPTISIFLHIWETPAVLISNLRFKHNQNTKLQNNKQGALQVEVGQKQKFITKRHTHQQELIFLRSKTHTRWSLEMGIFSSPLNFSEAFFARTNTPKTKINIFPRGNLYFCLCERNEKYKSRDYEAMRVLSGG